jgi:hypothetical protein
VEVEGEGEETDFRQNKSGRVCARACSDAERARRRRCMPEDALRRQRARRVQEVEQRKNRRRRRAMRCQVH